MDLLITSPNPVATNLMGSDFVQVPELEAEKIARNSSCSPPPPPTVNGDSLVPTLSSLCVLPPPPPLTPAPSVSVMDGITAEEQAPAAPNENEPPTDTMEKDTIQPTSEPEGQTTSVVPSNEQPQVAPATPVDVAPETLLPLQQSNETKDAPAPIKTTTAPQIMTRKRSSMSAVNSAMLFGGTTAAPAAGSSNANGTTGEVQTMATLQQQGRMGTATESEQPPQPPAKKKKKSTPKPKKTPDTANGNAPATGATVKPPSKSKAKKAQAVVPAATVEAGSEVQAKPPAKPKKASKPKAPKKTPSTTTAAGSSKSKSKKGKSQATGGGVVGKTVECGVANFMTQLASQRGMVPPLRIQMPKLTRMPGTQPVIKTEAHHSDWSGSDHGDNLYPMMLAETEMMMEDGSDENCNGKGGSRKKKSKGRNGNIYIGVFNRIEWMKLQNEFGFGSVNNFGTFVLQTMRRVHGDIQFWCDLAVASGIYPDLDHYEWNNGFPHAVNKEGQYFTPEPEPMSDEKREELIEVAKGMWDQRLQQLKQQQQALQGEGDVVALETGEEGEEDEDEDDDAMPGLEHYLENMASGQATGLLAPSLGKLETITEEDVSRVWNEQINNAASVETFGNLFNLVNSISGATEMKPSREIGTQDQGQKQKIAEDGVEKEETQVVV